MPLSILVTFLALVLGTALLTNSVKSIVFTQGSFGYSTQVSDDASAVYERWQRALRSAEPSVGHGGGGRWSLKVMSGWIFHRFGPCS